MKGDKLLIRNATQVVTCSGFAAKKGKEMSDLHIINDGAVATSGGIITHVGSTKDVLRMIDADEYLEIDATGRALLPGFVDSHTHFVFAGSQEKMFFEHLHNDNKTIFHADYVDSVIETVEATRKNEFEELWDIGYARLDEMLDMGVTTVEGKSGYGLDFETELKQLRVMADLNEEHPIDIISTYLGGHVTAPEYTCQTDDYITYIIEQILPELRMERTVTFCDVFCAPGLFSLTQSERLLRAARSHRFKLKMHADATVSLGGAELATRLKVVSADHLLHISDEGIKRLARSGVVATLLPLSTFSQNLPCARGRAMIDAGCAVAMASDFNPSTSFSCSIPMLFSLACIQMKLTPEEAVTALTINGAAALGRANKIGSIDVGKKADLILLKYPSYKFLPYNVGMNIVDTVIKDGFIYMV
ncbi:imidazolonepropionase [Parabacteroides sp.]